MGNEIEENECDLKNKMDKIYQGVVAILFASASLVVLYHLVFKTKFFENFFENFFF
ncbi:MAG: hypothetical protein V1851_02015 [Patescibacteria group bacterium]